MRKRLEVYQSQTRPLVDYYSSWAASGDADAPRYRKHRRHRHASTRSPRARSPRLQA